MVLRKIRQLIRQDLAMDLGTANTLIYFEGEGIVLNEPTAIAMSLESAEVLATGSEAKKYLGKTPKGIMALRPLKEGVIRDFGAASLLIQDFLKRVEFHRGVAAPRIVVCIPSNITQVEKRTVLEAAYEAGGKKVFLLEETMAAAIGAGLPVFDSRPVAVLDIGGGTTEFALITEGGYRVCETIRLAGDVFDEAIVQWFKYRHHLEIGLNSAEQIKWEAGAVSEKYSRNDASILVSGKDRLRQAPLSIEVPAKEIAEALKEPVTAIRNFIIRFLAVMPVSDRASVEAQGVTITGGGALLAGLPEWLSEQTGINFSLAAEPLTTVVMGAGLALENFKEFEPVFIN